MTSSLTRGLPKMRHNVVASTPSAQGRIALEPWTTPHQTITEAMEHGTHLRLAPGEALEVEFKAVAFVGFSRVSTILPDGRVEGETDGE